MTTNQDVARTLAKARLEARRKAVSARKLEAEFEAEHLPRYAAAKKALRQCARKSSPERIKAALLALASVLADDECEGIEDAAAKLRAYSHVANDDELMRLAGRADRARRP